MQQETSRARTAVEGAMHIISAQGVSGSEALRQLQTATEALNRIQAALGRFEIGLPPEPRRF